MFNRLVAVEALNLAQGANEELSKRAERIYFL